MPQKTNWFLIVLIGVIVISLVFPEQVANFKDSIMGVKETPVDKDKPKAPVEFCSDPSTTMRIGPMQKMYAPGTSVSTEYARVFVGKPGKNLVDQGLKVDKDTIGVSWKDKIEIYYAENSSTYYAAKTAFDVDCAPTIDTANYDGDAHKLYEIDASTNLNFRFWCEDDGLVNAVGTQEELAAGDGIVTITGDIRSQFEDAYSPYGGIYATVLYNSTSYNKVDFSVDTAGYSVSDATTPTVRSNAASAAGYSLKTYKINKGLISNQKIDFALMVEVHPTNEPNTDGGDIIIYFDDEDWFRNTDTGKMEFGPEDNDDVIVGDAVNTATLYVS